MKKRVRFLYNYFQFLLPLLIMVSLAACSRDDANSVHKGHAMKSLYEQVKPLSVNEESFQKIVGWLDNDTFVYITEEKSQSLIYSYNLRSGQQKILFRSDTPIKNVLISPDKNKLLVHSASLTYLATIKVIDLKGNVLFSKKVASYDLSFNWNKENPNLILTTVFFEDWSFQVNLLNVKDETFKKYTFSDPFVKWFKQDEILFQYWNKNEMHFFAPLLSYSLKNVNHGKTLFDNIYRFDTFQHYLMTITIPEKNKDDAVYHFYNDSLEEMYAFTVPHLSQYDNWVVPNYDLIKNDFITFVPYNSGSLDEYHKKFRLIKYNIHTKYQKMIIENLKNEPIVCSPDGKTCLYGNQLNQLIDLEKGEIKPIVQYEKKSP